MSEERKEAENERVEQISRRVTAFVTGGTSYPEWPDDMAWLIEQFVHSLHRNAALLAERDRWQTLFYESEEYNCSCNVVDMSKPVGDSLNYVCDWHQKHPHIALAREKVLTLAERLASAEAQICTLKKALEEKVNTLDIQQHAKWKYGVKALLSLEGKEG